LSECQNCTVEKTSKKTGFVDCNQYSSIKNVIGVMSGKGGVGKSTVSVMIANRLSEMGNKVGILDADMTGPSIPRLLKVNNRKAEGSELGILPAVSDNGIKVMSLNLLLEDEEQPVIWRGPLIAGAVKQFWTDVFWGDLDYLIIDMPPGTGDVALTVMQSIPLDGIVVVSVPQDLVSMIVAKAVNMAKSLNIEVIGLVENMSYLICPHCNEKINIFDYDERESFLNSMEIPLLGELPMSKGIADITKGTAQFDEEIKKDIDEITNKLVNFINNKGGNEK